LVAGCGVGGALLAKTLTDAGAHVTILERTSEFRRFGGPIQLASNALSTLQAKVHTRMKPPEFAHQLTPTN
jgi:zeaxanthin epoxidase